MDYVKASRSFINSHYLNEGIRMTAGILTPALLLSFFDLLDTGVVISLGAFFVSMTDSPGPIHHRKNGMAVCNVVIFLVAIITGFVDQSPLLLGLFILASCFVFTMIGVYGARAGSIGIAALVLIVLSIEQERNGWDILYNALYVISGGVWYMCFSMLLYSFRPYKLIQQALGEWIQNVGDYLKIRVELYKKNVDYEEVYRRLLQQQAVVQEKQNMVNELIFKTRSIVKETTHTGRILVMLYLDVADMFERIMTSYQKYSILHEYFDGTDILDRYYILGLKIAGELEDIGIAVKSGTSSANASSLKADIEEAENYRIQLRTTYMRPDNFEGFITLRRILENIQDLAERLQTLHKYTTYDISLKKRKRHEVDFEELISHESITPRPLIDNLTFNADIFRHTIRLSLALMVGYIVSLFFDIGHKAWILLTIIVILKPAYSLTKKRNKDRLLGTILGVLIGVVILQFVDNGIALLIIMIIFMAANFMVMRQNYFWMVLLMTPYIILFFHLINPTNFRQLLTDRVVDTAIGSVIAFAASMFLFPSWERRKIKPLMIKMLEEAVNYFTIIGEAFAGERKMTSQEQQVARKQALVALANLSDAFNRMLSEPKTQQKGIEDIHRFVVLNHMLTSYLATLSTYLKKEGFSYSSTELITVVEEIKQNLVRAKGILDGENVSTGTASNKEALQKLVEEADLLLEKRIIELEKGLIETPTKKRLFEVKSIADQMNLIHKVAGDISKVSSSLPSHLAV